jgi:hypothetical protein
MKPPILIEEALPEGYENVVRQYLEVATPTCAVSGVKSTLVMFGAWPVRNSVLASLVDDGSSRVLSDGWVRSFANPLLRVEIESQVSEGCGRWAVKYPSSTVALPK